jgi:hypothetical protein
MHGSLPVARSALDIDRMWTRLRQTAPFIDGTAITERKLLNVRAMQIIRQDAIMSILMEEAGAVRKPIVVPFEQGRVYAMGRCA